MEELNQQLNHLWSMGIHTYLLNLKTYRIARIGIIADMSSERLMIGYSEDSEDSVNVSFDLKHPVKCIDSKEAEYFVEKDGVEYILTVLNPTNLEKAINR